MRSVPGIVPKPRMRMGRNDRMGDWAEFSALCPEWQIDTHEENEN